jgi:cation-transporting ATPase 13A1
MITGDAVLTAAEVARQVGIVRRTSSAKHTIYRIKRRSDNQGIDSSEGNQLDPLSFFECTQLTTNESVDVPMVLARTKIGSLLDLAKQGEASFCISGDVLVDIASTAAQVESSMKQMQRGPMQDEKNLLLSPAAQSILTELVPLVSVFARHAPHQKEAVISALNHGGFQTLMCGDGTYGVLNVRAESRTSMNANLAHSIRRYKRCGSVETGTCRNIYY